MTTSPLVRRVPIRPELSLHVLDWQPAAPAAPAASAAPGGDTVFVLVHGLASNARLWDGVALALAARGHRAVSIDQRGHGHSDKPDDGYDMGTVADDLALLLDELGLDRPVVAGQSWGANVVVELAARHPGRTRGIAPVDGGFIDLASRFASWEDCREKLAPPRLAGTPLATMERWMRGAHPDWPETGIQGALANLEVRPDGTVAPWLTFDRHMKVLRGLWDHRPGERFPDVQQPVLWMPADSGDVAWTDNKRAGIQRAHDLLRDSRVHWFSPADHDLHAQFPDRVADLLIDAVVSGWMA